jgi:hypothetical protein
MDIVAALTMINQALTVVKAARDLEKGYDAAVLKGQMADLYGTLADVKIALSDARDEIHERDQKVKILEDRIAALTSGEACPLCEGGRLKVIASKPDRIFGEFGVQERTLKCNSCSHEEKRQHDPTTGAAPKSRR